MLGLGAALAASAVLLLVAPANQQPPPAGPVPAAIAWPKAKTGTIAATLPDGSIYTPAMFLDARTSVGTAPSRDGKSLRLLWRGPTDSIRQLRRLPIKQNPYFGNVTADGDVLAWAEGTGRGHLRLWTINLRDGRPPRPVTADTGDVLFNDSQYDLSLHDGRLYWVASDPNHYDAVQVRSVALTGGPVEKRAESGTWALSSWPWLVDGATDPSGSSRLRNLVTNRDVTVHRGAGLQTTNCSPTWCQVVSMSRRGSTRVELRHPNGDAHERIPTSTALPAITEVAPLDRFAVLSQTGPNSGLTRNEELLVFEIATRRTVELSFNAATVFYGHGVLWWSNGGQNVTNWHTVDLRTV